MSEIWEYRSMGSSSLLIPLISSKPFNIVWMFKSEHRK